MSLKHIYRPPFTVMTCPSTVIHYDSCGLGQLGDGTQTGPTECFPLNFCSPTPVPVSELKGARAIAAGNSHNLTLLSDGEVKA
jgi:hypothetical protein